MFSEKLWKKNSLRCKNVKNSKSNYKTLKHGAIKKKYILLGLQELLRKSIEKAIITLNPHTPGVGRSSLGEIVLVAERKECRVPAGRGGGFSRAKLVKEGWPRSLPQKGAKLWLHKALCSTLYVIRIECFTNVKKSGSWPRFLSCSTWLTECCKWWPSYNQEGAQGKVNTGVELSALLCRVLSKCQEAKVSEGGEKGILQSHHLSIKWTLQTIKNS